MRSAKRKLRIELSYLCRLLLNLLVTCSTSTIQLLFTNMFFSFNTHVWMIHCMGKNENTKK